MTLPPLMIAVAPNGARKTRDDHPALPVTPRQLAETAKSCLEAGAGMIHLHVRDKAQKHLLDAEAYQDATAAIREAVGQEIVVQITTEAVGIYQPEEQMAVVRATRPEAVSLGIREFLPDPESPVETFAAFLRELHEQNVMAQYILYDVADIERFQSLQAEAVIPQKSPNVLFVLGRYSKGQVSQPADLLPMLAAWGESGPEQGQGPKDAPSPSDNPQSWMICAFGALEGASAITACALGGHARIGFENNMLLADGRVAPDNAALVRQVAEGAALCGRRTATAEEIRQMMAGR